jgi:hypothetical protein
VVNEWRERLERAVMARNTKLLMAIATMLALVTAVGAAQLIRLAYTASAGKSPA